MRDANVLKGAEGRLDGLALAGRGGEEPEGVTEVGGDIHWVQGVVGWGGVGGRGGWLWLFGWDVRRLMIHAPDPRVSIKVRGRTGVLQRGVSALPHRQDHGVGLFSV